MKATALILSTLLFVFAVKEAEGSIRNYVNASATGENSEVDVKIDNNFGTGTTNTSSVKSESTTKVDITQEGTGTSSVTINGKEYKVEGAGSLHVDESTNGSPTISPSEDGSTTATPTSSESQEEPNSVEENKSFIERFFRQLREDIRNLFASLF